MSGWDAASAQAVLAIAGIVPDGVAAPVLLFRRAGESYSLDHQCAGAIAAVDDGVTLQFAMPAIDRVDFALLLLPAIPGFYAIHKVEVAGEVVADLARRVISVHEQLEPGITPQEVRYASERGRPSIEVDLRGLGASLASSSIEILVAIRREASFAALSRLGDRVGEVSAQVRGFAVELGGILLSHGEHVHRLTAAGTEHAARIASVECGVERIEAAVVTGKASNDHRFDAIDAAVADGNARHAQAQERDRTMTLTLAELAQRLERLQAQSDLLVHAVENVFWRRWLRRLRGGRG